MDKLGGLLAFVKTADLGSFVAAGRALEVSASAVGKSVARLEHDLGVRLLQRSTRRMQLTAEGQQFHERCRRLLDELGDARAMLSQAGQTPRGRLRLSAPWVAHHFLTPLMPDFVARYPEVELDLVYTDRPVDLIEEGIDVAIRSGDLPDSQMVARPLQHFRLLLCAAPGYLARYGKPDAARALGAHAAVRFRHPASGKLLDWPMLTGLHEAPDYPRTVMACNHMEAVLGAALRGVGIACIPDFLARQALADGQLVPVLDHLPDLVGQFKALWPSGRHLSPKVRAWVDFLGERLGAPAAG